MSHCEVRKFYERVNAFTPRYPREGQMKMMNTVLRYLETEVSIRFLQGMADRMAVSYAKYGPVAAAYPEKVDALESLFARFHKYKDTGNTEWLIDVSNFAMIEFMHPRHPLAHFRATDSNESIGRTNVDGTDRGQVANTVGQENLRLGGNHMQTAGGFYKNEGD